MLKFLRFFYVLAIAGALLTTAKAASFESFRLLGGWPTSLISAGADWSSDYGLDYSFGIQESGWGLQGTGDGVLRTSRPLGVSETGFSLDFKTNSPGGGRGDTYSTGNMTIPGAYEIRPSYSKVFSFTIKHHLGENDWGAGISTNARMMHYLSLLGDYIGQPIYYGISWSLRARVTGQVGVNTVIHALNGSAHTIRSGQISTGITYGSMGGSIAYYPYGNNWQFPALEINSEFGDGAGYPGQGEMELRVWVTLSTNEIWYSPSPAHMFVTDGPELKKLTYYGLQLESVDALPNLPVGMKVIGTGDFDQNGTDDIVIRGDSDGTGPQPVKTFLWLYQGSTRTRIVRLQNPLIDYTEPLGCHDFDRDSNKEVILFNPTTNRAKRFEISRADLDNGLTSVTFTEKTSLPWNATFTKIIGIADFNWDGNLDLLLRNPQNGTIKYRYMNGLNSAWYSENRRVPLSTTFIGISGSPISGTGYVVDSVDGVAPRKLWMMYDTHYGGEYEYTGDEAYRSWKVVGFGPYP